MLLHTVWIQACLCYINVNEFATPCLINNFNKNISFTSLFKQTIDQFPAYTAPSSVPVFLGSVSSFQLAPSLNGMSSDMCK